MQQLKLVTITLLIWLPSIVLGQSLAKDARAFDKSIKIIKAYHQSSETEEPINVSKPELLDATTTALAILFNYNANVEKDSILDFNWQSFLDSYSSNPLLNQAIFGGGYSLIPDSFSLEFNQQVWTKLDKIQSGPRHKMIELLTAKTSVEPSDYLSISKKLQEYTIPPLSTNSALALSAQNSNKNISNNIVNAQAVIEGLFNFILDRAQEEVVINFFEKLLNEDAPKVQELFPTVIERFSNTSFGYSNSFLERVRQAFYEDLQLLSVRLPELFLNDAYFKEIQEDPVAYNLMIVYSMFGMAQHGLTLDEILPITHRYIYDRYEDADKKINLHLAKSAANTPEYKELTAQTEGLIVFLDSIYKDLGIAQLNLDLFVDSLEIEFGTEDELVRSFLYQAPYDLEILLGGNTNFDFDLTLLPSMLKGRLESDQITKYNSIESYDRLFSIERDSILWRAAGLDITRGLQGTWYTDYNLAEILYNWHRDLVTYDQTVKNWNLRIDTTSLLKDEWNALEEKRIKLQNVINETKAFWENPPQAPKPKAVTISTKPQKTGKSTKSVKTPVPIPSTNPAKKIKGITHDQKLQFELLAKIVDDFSVIDELTIKYPDEDEEIDIELPEDGTLDTVDTSILEEEIDNVEEEIDNLEEGLELDTLDSMPVILDSAEIQPGIDTVENQLELEFPDSPDSISPLSSAPDTSPEEELIELEIDTIKNLTLKRARLMQVEQRLFILNDTLGSRNPYAKPRSPIVEYILDSVSTVPYANILNHIDEFADGLIDLEVQFRKLEKKRGGLEAATKANAKPALQFTEVLTYLMYGLRTDESKQKWISRNELDELLAQPELENAYLGLMYQRMSNIKNLGRFSPNGLAQLIQSTIGDIENLPELKDGKKESADSMAFHKKVAFGVNLFNRLLELPLTVDPDEKPGSQTYFKPIIEQKRGEKLKNLPVVNNQLSSFIYFLNVKDHRHAVSSGIRLFKSLTASMGKKKGKKCDPAINFLQQYGDFIAELIDADSATQVQDILSDIADPPGSSRIKRTKKLTVGLNAYLGASIGREDWDDSSVIGGNFLDVSPTIPVGITISWLGKNKYKLNASGRPKLPGSTSIFLSLLDLGEMLTLRNVDQEDYENIFAFKNVFKPSLQIHKNLQRSPFYLGLGGQLGTQYFNLNGVEQSISANKIFVSFGIDVPIKTLYQK